MSQRSQNNDRTRARMQGSGTGMTRKGASRAKPARVAGSTVRVQAAAKSKGAKGSKAGKVAAPQTKEEKAAAKKVERDRRDRVTIVSNIMVKQDPGYRQFRKVWWGMLIAGVVLTAVSWMCMFIFPGASSDPSSPMGVAAVVCLVLAYVAIIGGFIFDWVKTRPIRRDVETLVNSMSDKKLQQIIDEDYAASEARKAERKARRESR